MPGDVISYLCPAIATAAPYAPGTPLSITVAVRNCGGGLVSSHVTVRLWWEDPGTSFAQMRASRLVGVDAIPIPPRGETATTRPMVFSVPPSAPSPAHICLIACVEHNQDPPPKVGGALIPRPGLERHWAQHNLSYVAAEPNGSVNLVFNAANPLQRDSEFLFDVRPFMDQRLTQLSRSLRAEPIETECRVEIDSVRQLRDASSARRRDPTQTLVLKANGSMEMHLRMRLSRVPERGQYAAFELLQRRRVDESIVGGIAVVVTAPTG